ncbi:peptide-methionine (S)-S-oxide reductase [Macrococcus capreoli]|uniref:peptide-methionine (S)-S-oxide reductase n=1 Tax=Macrococcus capreoli TaxID=2982690 RepID=UPI003EE7F708
MSEEIIYIAGGCLWGVQAFMKTVPGVVLTEAGRANGTTNTLDGDYDGYAECVKVTFDSNKTSVSKLMEDFFLIIDPYSLNQQGIDVGEKYRTGVYSKNPKHLEQAEVFINKRTDKDKIMVEVQPLTNYIRSADEHQDYLDRHPNDYCHIPHDLMRKYK